MRSGNGMRAALLILAAALSWSRPALCAERYVAVTGSDAGPGTEARPWRTVRKAAATAVAGDTVYVKNGTYFERVVFRNSGTPGRRIIFKPSPGHSPVLSGRDKAQWDGFVNLSGVDYVRLEGFTITNCPKGQAVYVINAGRDPATHIELKKLTIDHVADSPVQIRGNAGHILVEGCTIHDCGASGVDVSHFKGGRPHHVTIASNTIYKSKFAGVGSEVADDLVVERNTVYDSSIGIDIGSGRRNVIRGNTIHHCSDGIALSSNTDSRVHDNVVHDVKEAMYAYFWIANGQPHANNRWYRNVVYNATWGLWEMNRKSKKHGTGPSSGHEYFNNLFYDIGGNPGYRSPFWFRGITDFRFYNNTIHLKPGHDAIELTEGCKGAVIRNNIVCMSGAATAVDINGGSEASVDHNCYWNARGSAKKAGRHDIVGDPAFEDPAGGDFRLKAGSPCIDSGAEVEGLKDDLERAPRPRGRGPDMGAFERSVPGR